MQCYRTPLLALWVDQSPYCSFVLFFFSHSLGCISCGYKIMCDTPIGTTRWITGQDRLVSKKLISKGAARDIVTRHSHHCKEECHCLRDIILIFIWCLRKATSVRDEKNSTSSNSFFCVVQFTTLTMPTKVRRLCSLLFSNGTAF